MAGADMAIEIGDRDSDGAAQAAAGDGLEHRIVSRVEGLLKVRLLYNRADFSRHDLLAPIYGWFTEGFETQDLKMPRRCSSSWRDLRFENWPAPGVEVS
jgi:hypothetical protein